MDREGIMLTIGDDGVASLYDDKWDITIHCESEEEQKEVVDMLKGLRKPNVLQIPETGIGDVSDGYHTFNGLYYQRMILFAALVKCFKDRAWKSLRHEDGELCFNGGWFIVGIDTPEGSYTYHYECKDWDVFDCVELERGKHWDGHTEDDVTRLLSLGGA